MRVTAQRLPENPIITPAQVTPLHPGWDVVCAFNAGAIQVDSDTILLLRVAERPPADRLQPNAMLLDLSGAIPHIVALDTALPPADLIPIPLLDTVQSPPREVVYYIRRDTPGLDASDPRLVKYQKLTYLTSISHIRLARSTDRVHFTVEKEAAFVATDPLEAFGVEDTRITEIDGTYYINYTAVSEHGIATGLATTRDFKQYEKQGIIFCPENRDVTIFPAKIGGRYAALHRPVPSEIGVPEVWFASSENMRDWGGHRFCFGSRPGTWDSRRIGGGAVPVWTERGWLEIYHGVDPTLEYALGAVLLDLEEPWKVLARSPEPILKPEEGFEREGFFGNVVFTCGCVQTGDRLRVYYGAADTVTAAAEFSISEILDSLEPVQ